MRFQILNRPLGFQHFPFLPLGVNLPLVIPTSLLPLFHLSLEGPDHQEEIGPKHPAKDAHDSASDVWLAQKKLADYELHDIENHENEADSSQGDKRLHEADVPLKHKYNEMLLS